VVCRFVKIKIGILMALPLFVVTNQNTEFWIEIEFAFSSGFKQPI
jgi:hypothetical protein